ncbi:hypothetical protein C2G38_266238 [Gigaspora rosea]|uniref:Uncharacterized protein n=1 Tax=Gigaspora rosea TaxID=44941 RepID=A0A397W298_9GLOM|nr:hypothetical protein C2G38_266238 [Gigaspora rosea]
MVFTYIAFCQVAKNNSFYASLHTEPIDVQEHPQAEPSNQHLSESSNSEQSELNQMKEEINMNEKIDMNKEINMNEKIDMNKEINMNEKIDMNEEIDNTTLNAFIEEIRNDYQNGGSQFRVALDKFTRQYHTSKAISFARLSSFLL